MKRKIIEIAHKIIRLILGSLRVVIRFFDTAISKDQKLWIFPQCYLEKTLKENALAVIDSAIKNDIDIKVCVLYYGNNKVDAQRQQYSKYSNVKYLKINRLPALVSLLKSKNIFVSHGHYDMYWQGIYKDLHTIVNLWHGIPIKKIRHAIKDDTKKNFLSTEDKTNFSTIASSVVDQEKMARCFNLSQEKVWLTGLPRNDFLHCDESQLPICCINQNQKLQAALKGRGLVLFAPTWRATKENKFVKNNFLEYLNFNPNAEALHESLNRNNMVLGLRLHPRVQDVKIISENVINVSSSIFPSTQTVLRNTEVLITDYSSIWVDYIQLKRKVIGYFPDFEEYLKNDRSLLYDFQEIFPGEIYTEFQDLIDCFSENGKLLNNKVSDKYLESVALFHKYIDTNNAQRLIDKLR